MDAFGISACAHAHTHSHSRRRRRAANNENCAWQKNYQHGDRVRYIRMNVFRVADPAALLSRLISKSNNVRAADSLRVSPARQSRAHIYIYTTETTVLELKPFHSYTCWNFDRSIYNNRPDNSFLTHLVSSALYFNLQFLFQLMKSSRSAFQINKNNMHTKT